MKNALLPIVLFFIAISANSQTLYINEFMASNSSTIADESGAFEDWIEIYNAGSSDIDIAGYYMSDDPLNPTLWQIPSTDPAATTIPAGGFLLLWADKDADEGELHLDFKLGAGGEDILLTLPDGLTLEDQVTFGPQSDDVSYGLTEDGGSTFDFFPASTPGTSNESVMLPDTYRASLTRVIDNGLDDGVEYGTSNGSVNLESYGIKMVESWSNQKVGLRFRDLDIPQEATIVSAYIQFTNKHEDDGVGYCNVEFEAEDSGDADPFVDEDMNFSDRPTTTEEVHWEPVEWLIRNLASEKQRSPDLSAIVQEVVDHSGWNVGSSLAFFISGEGLRAIHNFESGFPPSLHLEFDVPIPTNPVSNIYINEISPNGTDYTDETGDYEDWIELYNDNNFDVSLGGLFMTDDYTEPLQWQINESAVIPANGFLTIWADENTERSGRHADFKLKSGGEEVALLQVVNNEIVWIDSITYSAVPFKATTGRQTDGSSTWKIFGEITPLASNNGADDYLEPPVIDLPNGIYSGSQSVTISHPDPNATIRYTTDGSIPSSSSSSYNNPITIDENGSLRAVAFRSGYAPSQPATGSYLIGIDHDLPVLHIVTDPDNLWDDEIGIYTEGTNGTILDFCGNSVEANYNQDGWERPANLTFYESDDTEAFNVNAGIQIGGSCSREQALKALNIYLRNDRYGDKNIDYKLFPQKDYKKYKRLKLRNSGQDFRSSMFRDAAVQAIMRRIPDMEFQAYRPTVVYINDEYWGVQNFRELYSDEYFDHEEDVKKEDLQLIKNPSMSLVTIKDGHYDDYQEMFLFLENNSLVSQANYDIIADQVDIDNMINYWASMVYIANDDWPANNMLIWKEDKPGKKWRWCVVDTDASTNHYGVNSNTGHLRNKLAKIQNANSVTWPNHQNSTLLFRRLLENDDFKAEFVQRSCSFMHLVFEADSINPIVDNIVAALDSEMENHIDRWKFDTPYLESYEDWEEKIFKFRLFFEERQPYSRQHFVDTLGMGDTYELTVNFDENSGGGVRVNSTELILPYNYEGIYFEDLPLRLKAVADPGYQFVHWLETGETDEVIYFVGIGDYTLTPIFIPSGPVLTFECPPDINLTIFGASTTPVSWTEPTGTTTCDGGLVTVAQTGGPANGSDFPIGTTTITYEATDDCGNTSTCSFDVTVTLDNGSLNLTCPGDMVIDASPGATSVNVNWTEPTATTSCPAGGATVVQTAGPSNGDLFSIGTTAVSYEATDDCGNLAVCNFTVTVVETSSTINLVCPSNITVQVADGETEAIVTWTAPVGTSDCSIGSTSTTQVAGMSSGSSFPIGSHTISYETTDGCGSVAVCMFSIVVTDGPGTLTLDCPADQVIVLPVGATTTTVNWELPAVSTTCGGGTQNANCGASLPGFTSLGIYEEHEYFLSNNKAPWTVGEFDCASYGGHLIAIGSEEENDFLEDNVDVVVHIGLNDADVEGTLAWTNGESVGYTNFSSNSNNTDVNDYAYWAPWNSKWKFYSNNVYKYYVMELDCNGGSSINLTQTGGPANGSDLPVGVYTISYEATDDCGDLQVCSFTIEIQDNPQTISMSCPSNITVTETGGSGAATVNFANATATTSCSNGGLAVNQTGGLPSGSSFSIGTHNITFEATDNCGSVETCSFTITVEADAPPSGDYCESQGSNPWQHWLSFVGFNNISNSSGKSKYSDFTNISTTVEQDASYTFSLTPAFSWTQWDSHVRVWIDYNGDFDFDDAGEQAAEFIIPAGPSGSVPATGTATVTIPSSTSTGATRMRVAMAREIFVGPCQDFPYGEVEDYTVVITPGGTVQPLVNQNNDTSNKLKHLDLYPNPSKGILFVNLQDFSGKPLTLRVNNLLGQTMMLQSFDELDKALVELDVSNITNGMYTLSVQAEGEEIVVRQFVVAR